MIWANKVSWVIIDSFMVLLLWQLFAGKIKLSEYDSKLRHLESFFDNLRKVLVFISLCELISLVLRSFANSGINM